MLVFNSIADVAGWLSRRSRMEAAAFSLRSALRTMPALGTASTYWKNNPANEQDIVQIAFQSVSTAWSHLHPSEKSALENRVNESVLSTYSARLTLYVERSELLYELRTEDFIASGHAAKACWLAARAAVSTNVDALNAATGVVEAACLAASHQASAFRLDPLQIESILKACEADAALIENGCAAQDLLLRPLWLVQQSQWTDAGWQQLKSYIRSQQMDLESWIGWYEQRLQPQRPPQHPDSWNGNFSEAPFAPDALELGKQNDLPSALTGVAEGGPASLTPNLAMRPAMIQPVWQGDRLTLADAPLFDLRDEAFRDLLSVLREALSNLVTKLTNDSNCDPRMIGDLDNITSWISDADPSERLIFKLGHAKDILESNLSTVELEWPAIYSARYQAVVLQLNRMLHKCETWRAFIQAEEPLTSRQTSEVAFITAALARAFEEEGADFVDRAIPESLNYLSGASEGANVSQAASQRLARDGLESGSNSLKRLIGRLMEIARPASYWAEDAARRAGRALADGAKNGLASEAEQAGDRLGRRIWRVLTAIVRYAAITSSAEHVQSFFTLCADQYPIVFDWLKGCLTWLQGLL